MFFIWDNVLMMYRPNDDKSVFSMLGYVENLLAHVYKDDCKDHYEMNDSIKRESPDMTGFMFLPFTSLGELQEDSFDIFYDSIILPKENFDTFRGRLKAILPEDRYQHFKDANIMVQNMVLYDYEKLLHWTSISFDDFMKIQDLVKNHLTEEEKFLTSYQEMVDDSEDVHFINGGFNAG